MKNYAFSLLLLLLPFLGNSQCITSVGYDNIEVWDWSGAWWNTTGYYTNAAVSPTLSAAIIGSGGANSAYESDWYVLPPISVNPAFEHKFSFRLASYRFTSTATGSGVDVADYVTVQLSTDGGTNYVNEMRITGFSNAFWTYASTAVASKTANGTLTTYSPVAGGNRTTTGDGYSVIELTIPAGVSSVALDIFCRANANGEEWWLDNFLLEEIDPCDDPLPITLLSFTGEDELTKVRLDWRTASEQNNDYFIIERSTNGITWEEINRINGAGNSQIVMNYTEYDYKPLSGINYYRLTQVDFDGESETFDIIAVYCNPPIQKTPAKFFNNLGQEIDLEYHKGIYVVLYTDGTTEKRIK